MMKKKMEDEIMEYSSRHHYLREHSEEFYILKHHDTLFVYDYDHHLIGQIRKRNILAVQVSNDNQVVYFSQSNKKYFYLWHVYENKLIKVKYTELKDSDIKNIYEDDDNIYVFHHGCNKNGSNYAISTINKKTLISKENFLDEEEYGYPECFLNVSGQIYYSSLKFSDTSYENYFIYAQKDNNSEKVLETSYLNDPILKITDDGKYALLSSVHSMTSNGEIKVFDFKNYEQIDKITFYHIALYRIIANFFEFNGQVYIIYQANPWMCEIKKEVWHTYVYSISEKKIIHEIPYSFSLKYIRSKKILIMEKNRPRKEARFYNNVDESQGIEWIIKELSKKSN